MSKAGGSRDLSECHVRGQHQPEGMAQPHLLVECNRRDAESLSEVIFEPVEARIHAFGQSLDFQGIGNILLHDADDTAHERVR